MKFNKSLLKRFFKFFNKNLLESEISLLLTGKGSFFCSKETEIQINIINKYSWIFRFVPGLKAVFFCNTTAFRAVSIKSDIDLFIVSENNQLWICRIFTTFLIHVFGIRRYKNKITNRFCLSFFATEKGAFHLKDIQIKKNKDPYLAIWVATAECIICEPDFLKKFYKNNKWIHEYGLCFTQQNSPILTSEFQRLIGKLYKFMGIELLLKKIFYPRTMRKFSLLKNTNGIIISDDYLKFHNIDVRKKISQKF